ncbi:MAG: hypothetical protein ACRD0W_24260 [Acidimicrobiales bacterium]
MADADAVGAGEPERVEFGGAGLAAIGGHLLADADPAYLGDAPLEIYYHAIAHFRWFNASHLRQCRPRPSSL